MVAEVVVSLLLSALSICAGTISVDVNSRVDGGQK